MLDQLSLWYWHRSSFVCPSALKVSDVETLTQIEVSPDITTSQQSISYSLETEEKHQERFSVEK